MNDEPLHQKMVKCQDCNWLWTLKPQSKETVVADERLRKEGYAVSRQGQPYPPMLICGAGALPLDKNEWKNPAHLLSVICKDIPCKQWERHVPGQSPKEMLEMSIQQMAVSLQKISLEFQRQTLELRERQAGWEREQANWKREQDELRRQGEDKWQAFQKRWIIINFIVSVVTSGLVAWAIGWLLSAPNR